jgi:putative addiction module antidote
MLLGSTKMLLLAIGPEKAMVYATKLRRAGGSISATLPKDMADRQKLEPGDTVFVMETERGILITPYDPVTEEALAIARRVARRYRGALRELAR